MAQREQDDLPYRSPVSAATNSAPVTRDEERYDTLKNVHKILDDAVENLGKDFNAFTLYADKLPADRARMLLHDVEVKQGVSDVLAPILERVSNAISAVDSNFRRRQK